MIDAFRLPGEDPRVVRIRARVIGIEEAWTLTSPPHLKYRNLILGGVTAEDLAGLESMVIVKPSEYYETREHSDDSE